MGWRTIGIGRLKDEKVKGTKNNTRATSWGSRWWSQPRSNWDRSPESENLRIGQLKGAKRQHEEVRGVGDQGRIYARQSSLRHNVPVPRTTGERLVIVQPI